MEMERRLEEKKAAELKEKGNVDLERKIENGKITFDHTGKVITISHIKAERLPNDFRKVVSHRVDSTKQSDTTKKLKIKKSKDTGDESDHENRKFHYPEQTLMSKFKDSDLIKSHADVEASKDLGKTVQSLKPTNGVVYQPDIDSPEKIRGEPYNQQQREFQEKVLRKISQRHLSIKDIAKQMIKRNSTISVLKNNESNFKSFRINEDSNTEITDDRVFEEDNISRAGSTLNTKKSMLSQRLKHNQSHEPILKRNEYSFINSKLESSDIKQQLMDYDMNKTYDNIGIKSNLVLAKTSLMLPPISIGNMQCTIDLNDSKPKNNQNKIKSRFISPIQTIREFGNFTNRSKISIKSEIADKFRSTSTTSRDVVFKSAKRSQSDISFEGNEQALPNIESSKIHKLAKRPNKINRLSFASATSTSFALGELPVTKKLKKQIDFIKSLETAKLNLRSKIYSGNQGEL